MAPVVGLTIYPTILGITNLVRSLVMDDMAGAGPIGSGQIFVNDTTVSVTLQNFFNSSARTLARRLRLTESPSFIRDNYVLLNCPVVNGPQGSGVADPMVQCALTYTGFFDGTQIWPNFTLPADCLQVLEAWERQSGSNFTFVPMTNAPFGLPGISQGVLNGQWEWRQDAMWFRGTLSAVDIRLRCKTKISDLWQNGINLATTYLNIQDSNEAMAYLIAEQIAERQVPGTPTHQAISAKAEKQVQMLITEQTKDAQGQNYSIPEFGSETIRLI